jgi:hypothetical protein
MEFLFFAALFLFFWARANKKKRQQAGDKWAGFEENKRRLAPEQEKYDRMLFGLPELIGDNSFSQDVVGEQAYKDTLDLYGEYLEKYHPGEEEIWVLVELEPDNEYDENAVRVEAGQATVGYIPRSQAEDFGKELRSLGGKARANARFYWDPEGGRSSLTIDAVRPLKKK